MPSVRAGSFSISWETRAAFLMHLSPVNDIYPICIDVQHGVIYGNQLRRPDEVDLDTWLLEQSEREDVVVANNKVIPIIGHFTPFYAAHRYYASINVYQMTDLELLSLVEDEELIITGRVVSSGLERFSVGRDVNIVVSRRLGRAEIANELLRVYSNTLKEEADRLAKLSLYAKATSLEQQDEMEIPF